MKYKYDIFISYTRSDRLIVRRLGQALREKGFAVWLDEHEIELGDRILAKIQEGVKQSRYLALWLTNDSVKSKWVELEWQTMLRGELDGQDKKVLTLLGEQCEIPGLLKDKLYARFSESFEEGLAELVRFLESRSSFTITECAQGLIDGVDAKSCAKKLAGLAKGGRDEYALQALWDSAQKTKMPLDVVDHCSWYVGEIVIESTDPEMQLAGLRIIEESAVSGIDILVDKFAYAAGDVALRIKDMNIKKRMANFIAQCAVSDNHSLRKWYTITKNRIKEHDEKFFEKFLGE